MKLSRIDLTLSAKKRELLEKMLGEEGIDSSSAKVIARRAERGPAPLSFAQQRLWLIEKLEPGTAAYNLPYAVSLKGRLEAGVLEKCINEVVRRHESLRTSFALIDDATPAQIIAPEQRIELPLLDLRHMSAEARERETRRLISEEAALPFNLEQSPLMRVKLLRVDEQEHVLLITMHHIVSDAWSAEILIKELASLYHAFSQGLPSPLPELPIQYADYAQWQRESLRDDLLDKQLSYWKQQLSGIPAAIDLPTDKPRPVVQSYRGATEVLHIGEELSRKLRAMSRREGVTMYMLMLAAFDVLLMRYSRQSDIVVGTPIAGRSTKQVEALIGFFVNTLVMRVDVREQESFRGLLKRVREVAVGAYENQDIAFERLVEQMQPVRDLSRSPLFQVVFSLQNVPKSRFDFGELSLSPIDVESGTSKFDLLLQLEETDEEIQGIVEYNTDLFERPTVKQMLRHYERLLEAVAANPEQRVGELEMLTDAERHRLLVDWNSTSKYYPTDKCVHQIFEAQAALTPEAAAVIYEGHGLTYGELNERANRLAHYLISLGVGPDMLVGLCAERGIEMVVGMLAIVKAGGAYLPLEPAYPKDRLSFMLDDARIEVLLTQERLRRRMPAGRARIVSLDGDRELIEQHDCTNPCAQVAVDNLAYTIYTSGSTGEPKGVAVEHKQLLNYLNAILERLDARAGASFATVSTLAADLGNTVIIPSLCTGGCLHVISQERAFNADALADYFTRHEIDYLKIVPSHLAALQASSRPEAVLPRRMLILGGEASDTAWVSSIRAMAPDCAILNHYGPTETTVGVLTCKIEAGQAVPAAVTLPLGRPIANAQIYLLDDSLRPVPAGVPGELYIGGRNVARGYLNRPHLTAERFIPDPFSTEPGSRLYRTGDLARHRPDGNIEFLRRIDGQVKIRGFRVETEEIEAALKQHTDVREAVVQAREQAGSPGNKRLVAYVVPDRRRAPRAGRHVRYKLPNNLAVAHLNKNETDYIYKEIFELQAYLRHGIEIRDGDCVFDVGSNIGLFTLFVNQLCKDPRVYAFEPNPYLADILKANFSLYAPQAKLFECGLSDEAKTTDFTFYAGFSLLSGLYADPEAEKQVIKAFMMNQQSRGEARAGELVKHADAILEGRMAAETFQARLRTLSEVIEEEGIERIDLLKINAEKSELDVLRGIKDDDWSRIEQVVLEVDVKENLEAITSLLERHGYDLTVEQDALLENTQLCYVYAVRPSEGRKLIREQREGAHIRRLPLLAEPVLSASELKNFLSQRLPDYMVPSAFVMLEEMPLTPNGKLDRRALPHPASGGELEAAYVAPATELERAIAAIWKEALRVEKVGLYDNFFDLGGHSLLLVQVYSKLRAALNAQGVNKSLSVVEMFKYPTVSALAKYLNEQVDEQLPAEQGRERAQARRSAIKELIHDGRRRRA